MPAGKLDAGGLFTTGATWDALGVSTAAPALHVPNSQPEAGRSRILLLPTATQGPQATAAAQPKPRLRATAGRATPPSPGQQLAPRASPERHPQAQEQSPSGHRGETGEGVDGALPFRSSQSEAGDTTLDKQPEDLSGAQRSSAVSKQLPATGRGLEGALPPQELLGQPVASVTRPAPWRPRLASQISANLLTSAHKDCPMPQGTDPVNPDLPSVVASDHVTGKDKQMGFCWDPWQTCFQTTHGYLSDSRSCSSNYSVAALATSSLVGVAQSTRDHIPKPTAMARGRVAHLIEWKGWSAQRAGWELPPADNDEHYHRLPDELWEARFAAGVAEQFAITEATLSAWSSLDDGELGPESSPADVLQLQDLGSVCLQDSLLSVRLQDDRLLAFSSPHGWPSPDEPPSPGRQLRPQLPGALGPEGGGARPQGPLCSGDGGLPSEEEDEVFYN
ncbi:LOW QUALITY PROTEIN: protein FAM131C [Capricornis sumatraensis]|uniref:LOW QUALITY PROTEIN: protein FAM131C n=1 Tax=Capricornis sumatraensis TaxID=34865 RepID=UPI003604DD23